MVVPRFLVSGPFADGAGWCSLSELVSPQLYRWTLPCFSGRKIDARTDLAAACPDGTPVPVFQVMLPTPATQQTRAHFRLVFSAPKVPELGTKKPITATATGGRSGHFGTHLGVTGGTQTHSRRTGRKLGQLPCARQGLVRVPESNTKYGGKRRKTGGA